MRRGLSDALGDRGRAGGLDGEVLGGEQLLEL
jgi:hypothetical protein